MNISKLVNVSSNRQLLSGNKNRKSFFSLLHTASFKKVAVYIIISLLITFLLNSIVIGQSSLNQQEEFKKTLSDRSRKIVATLEITDSGKFDGIVKLLTDQYFNLNKIHDGTKEIIAMVKTLQLTAEEKEIRIKSEEEEKKTKLKKLHGEFIEQLQKKLTEEQIEKVKEGMTYKVMSVTYSAYLNIILTLTPEQKEKIYNWLKEARELAMDEGSSEDKHKVFGKYKGKINNYLSSQGYDMKKEEKAWQQRMKERQAVND